MAACPNSHEYTNYIFGNLVCLTGAGLSFLFFLILYEGVGVIIGSVGLVIPDHAQQYL